MGKQVQAPSQTQTQNTQMSPQQGAEWDKQIGNTQNTIAGDIGSVNYGQTQSQLGQMSNNILGNQVNSQQLAAPIAQAGQANWATPGTAQNYMSPYENTALASTVGLAQSQIENPQLASMQRSDAASGALGGSRGAINQGLYQQQFNQGLQNTINQGESQAYDTGQKAFEADASRNLTGQTSAANTQLAGNASNIYANLGAQQPLMNQITASEAPGQQMLQGTSALAMQPHEGTTQTTGVSSPGSKGALGNVLSVVQGAGQGLAAAFGAAKGGLIESKANGGILSGGKRPSANVGIPFENYEAGMKKGGILSAKKSKKSKGKK